MADNPHPLPKGYTRASIQLLREGCEYYYPFVIPEKKGAIAFGQGKFGPWNNSGEFKKALFEVLPDAVDDIEKAHKILQAWEPIAPESIAPDKQPDSNVPDKERLGQMEEEAKRREKAITEAQEKAKTETQTQIDTLTQKAKEKVVYLEPENVKKITLTPNEELAVKNFEKAAAQDPNNFISAFSKKIIESLPAEIKSQLTPEELVVTSQNVAADFLGRVLRKEGLKSLTTGIFVGLINSPSVPAELKKEVLPVLTALSQTSESVVRSFLHPLIGQNLTEHYYESPENTYKVTETQTPNSTTKVDLGKLGSDFQAFKSNPVFGFLEGKVKSELTKHGQRIFSEFVSKLPKKGVFGVLSKVSSNASLSAGFRMLAGSGTTYQVTNVVGWTIRTTLPDFVPMISFAAQRFGINVGLTAVNTLTPAATSTLETGAITSVAAGTTTVAGATGVATTAAVAGTAVGEGAAVAAGAAVATTGAGAGAATGSGLGALLGPLAPIAMPILAAIGAAVGAIIGKVVEKVRVWIKKNPEKFAIIGLAPLVLGVISGSVVLILVGGVAFTTVFFAAKGMGAVSTGIVTFAFGAFTSVLSASIGHFGKAITLTLLGIIAFTALVLFIINSGAYLVPPGGVTVDNISQSPYIKVTKEASVTSLSNSQLPTEVTFTVTVEAPLGALTNISFKNECNVIKDGVTPGCSHPVPSEVPETIDTTNPFVFSYPQSYTPSFSDSLTTDTFTVEADVPGNERQVSLASASVVIGTPPTACFDIKGTNWPANYKGNVLAAIATLRNSYPAYTAKLCSGGTLNVVYDTTKNPGGWGYYSSGTIYFNGKGGLSSAIDALYIVSHETGHHYQFSTGPGSQEYVRYLNNTPGVNSERPLCSYSNTTIAAEAFAEAVALYVTNDNSSQWTARCSGSFELTYPAHYNFANDVIFR